MSLDDVGVRDEYDFSDGVRGKHSKAFSEGSNVIVLEPELVAEFKTSKSVNDALRDELQRRRRGAAAG